MTGQAPSLNIHLCTRVLWITESSWRTAFKIFFFLSISLSLANQCRVYGYEHASVLFLRGHTSADALKQIALLLWPLGNRNRGIRSCVKSVWQLWFLTCRHACILLDYFVSSLWCTDLYQVMQSVGLVDLMHCLAADLKSRAHVSSATSSSSSSSPCQLLRFITPTGGGLWYQPGHYLWQCLARLLSP